MVERMKAAGCIVIGKTNTPEFGLGSHTFNEVFGVTAQRLRPARKSAGGSSGGAAVALATRMLPVADGSDFMGSLRNPAGWNNVFGFRPSQGRVPRWPAADVWVAQLSTEGPMGAHRAATSPRCSTCRPGYDAARAALARDDGARSPRALDGARRARRCASAGSATSTATWRWSRASLEVCERGAARGSTALGGAVEPIALGFAPERSGTPGWSGGAGWSRARIAPHLTNPENRDLIKPEALWEHDQGAGA